MRAELVSKGVWFSAEVVENVRDFRRGVKVKSKLDHLYYQGGCLLDDMIRRWIYDIFYVCQLNDWVFQVLSNFADPFLSVLDWWIREPLLIIWHSRLIWLIGIGLEQSYPPCEVDWFYSRVYEHQHSKVLILMLSLTNN